MAGKTFTYIVFLLFLILFSLCYRSLSLYALSLRCAPWQSTTSPSATICVRTRIPRISRRGITRPKSGMWTRIRAIHSTRTICTCSEWAESVHLSLYLLDSNRFPRRFLFCGPLSSQPMFSYFFCVCFLATCNFRRTRAFPHPVHDFSCFWVFLPFFSPGTPT